VGAILAQEFGGELELIVVDDASTDETPAIFQRLAASNDRRLLLIRSEVGLGAGGGRNLGLNRARGEYVAFTDSDCVPAAGWIAALLSRFDSPRVGIVQGRTTATEEQSPLFSHYIVTSQLDGSYSTSNVVYRIEALAARRFDPAIVYWEDVDLAWRVLDDGWESRFAPEALVRHQVIPITALRWILWPRKFGYYPAKAARYPGFRRHLFLRLWVSPIHFWFDLAVLGLLLAVLNRWALLLLIPYLVELVRTRGFSGRFPPAKAAAHIAWDAVALGALLVGSARYRSLVL
jgi:glycosyltransferase involved in cell wall biosynthesis